MISIFDDAKVSEVLVPAGSFDNGQKKLARAPCLLVTLPTSPTNRDITSYVMTYGTGARGTDSDVYDGDDRVLTQSRNTFGYPIETVVVDGAIGSYKDDPFTWKGVHEFHFI